MNQIGDNRGWYKPIEVFDGGGQLKGIYLLKFATYTEHSKVIEGLIENKALRMARLKINGDVFG